MKNKFLLYAFVFLLSASSSFGQFTFTDNASNSAYGSGWAHLSNGGNGFNDWVISSGGSNAGTFKGNPYDYGMSTANIGTTAFGLYGHSGQYVNAIRYFGRNAVDARMQVGDSFSFWWSMNWDAGGGNKGFDLRAGGTTIFNVNNGGSATISTTNGNASTDYGTNAMLVTLTRTSWTQYTFTMTRRHDGSTYSTTINSSSAIDNINIYCGAQLDNNVNRNIFFNHFAFNKANPYAINGTVTEPRILQGSGNLTKTGVNHRLYLTAPNTFTGNTTVSEGFLVITADNNLGAAPGSPTAGKISVGNGSFEMNGTFTLNANRGITLTHTNSTLDVYGPGTKVVTYDGVIAHSGTHGMRKLGGGVLVLRGANTYTGLTTVTVGTLELNRTGGNTLNSTNNVTINGGTLRVRSNQTLNNVTLSSGTLIVDNGVTLTINGTFSGGGTIQNNGTIQLGGTTAFPGSATTISAMNNVIINSAGAVTLDKALTISGNLTLTNGLLTLGSHNLLVNGTLSGGSSSSYINTNGSGTFRPRVAATGANTFHFGSAGVYSPVVLNFTAASFGSDPRLIMGTGTGVPSQLHASNTQYVGRTWVIEPQDITAFTYTIEFTYDASELTMGTDESNLIPVKLSSGTWYRPVGTGASLADEIEQGTYAINTATNTVTWSGLTTFSSFLTVEDSSNPLPVTLTSFNANCNGGDVVLKWSTASEYQASHFTVQSSRDGLNWNTMGEVEAAGTTNQTTNYQFATKNHGALTYFRLVQVDLDGATEIFGPISSACDLKENSVFVFPNPVVSGDANHFTLSVESMESVENANIQVLDMMGKVIYTQNANLEAGVNQFLIKTESMNAGTFVIHILNDKQQFDAVRVVLR